MRLYELATQYKELQALEDMDPEVIADTLEALEGDVEEKAIAIVKVREGMTKDIDAIDSEIARLSTIKKQIQNRDISVREYLKSNMQRMGLKNIKCPYFSITLAAGRETAVIDDESLLPDDYVNVKTTIAPDKKKILADLKSGVEVSGARIVRSDESLRIK